MAEGTDLAAQVGGGVTLAVTVTGEGAPLLLIPGLGSARRVYDPIVPMLARRCRVIVYDPRGIGESSAPSDGRWSMAALADDAVRVLDAAGVDRATVFGASMGGMVAQWVAINHPDRVARLILAATNPGGAHMVRPDPADRARLMGVGARTPGDAYRIACTVLYGESFRRAHPEFIDAQVAERAMHPVSARAFAAQAKAASAHDAADGLARISAPTLVLHGSLDVVSPVANAGLMADRIPDSRVVLLDGNGHLFFHEAPDWSAALISEFAIDET